MRTTGKPEPFKNLPEDPTPDLAPFNVTFGSASPERVILAEGNLIEWQMTMSSHIVVPTSQCLFDFVSLVDQPVESVVAFVKTWGPLALTPEIHEGVSVVEDGDAWGGAACGFTVMPDGTGTYSDPVFREPLQLYYDYARYAKALLASAEALALNQIPNEEDRNLANINREATFPLNIRDYRFELAGEINNWLKIASVSPSLSWMHDQYVLGFIFSPHALYMNGWDHARKSGQPLQWRKYNTQTKQYESVIAPRPSWLMATLGIEIAKIVLHPKGHKRCERCQQLFYPFHRREKYCGKLCKAEVKKEQDLKSWHKNKKKP